MSDISDKNVTLLSPAQRHFQRLKRSNFAILAVLVLFAAFFYALTVVRIGALPASDKEKGVTEKQETTIMQNKGDL